MIAQADYLGATGLWVLPPAVRSHSQARGPSFRQGRSPFDDSLLPIARLSPIARR